MTILLKPLKLRQACQKKGGDLASLAKNQVMASIWPFVPEDNTMIMSGGQRKYTGGYWIGGVRKTVAGSPNDHWEWLTGEPIPPKIIHVIYGISDGDVCAAYYKVKGYPKASIIDDKCNEKRPGYICQFHSNLLHLFFN